MSSESSKLDPGLGFATSEGARKSTEVTVHHIRPATPNAVLFQEVFAPFAPVVLVDHVEHLEGELAEKAEREAKERQGAAAAGHEDPSLLSGIANFKVPDGEIELDEYPTNVGVDVVILSDDEIPDGGLWGWLVVVAAFLCNFVTIGIQQSFGVWIGYYLNVTFAGTASASQVSLINGMQGGFSFLLGPFVGRFCDKYGPRITCPVGVTLQVVANVSASFCTTIQTLWVTQGILFGIGCCFVQNSSVSAPAQWFSKKLSIALGISMCGSGLGGLALSFVTQSLLNGMGPVWTLRIYAIMNAALLFPSALALRTRAPPPGTIHRKQPLISLDLFKNFTFLRLFLGSFLCCWAFPAPFFVPSYLYDTAGMDPSHGATLLAVTVGMSSVSMILAGLVAPRFGILNTFVVSQFGAAVSIFLFWMPAGTQLALLYVYSVTWGLLWGCFFSMLAAAAAKLFVHIAAFPVVIGSIYLSLSFSFFGNGPVFGALVDAGAYYDPVTGARVGANYLYAQIWAGCVYLCGVGCLAWVRFSEARGKWRVVV